MANRKAWIILGITIILAMILGSCATPTAAPVVEVVKETVVSVETVVETVIQTVEVPSRFRQNPPAQNPKEHYRIAVSTYPNTLDAPLTAERNARITQLAPMFDSLLWVNDDGDIEPEL
jgi:P2-related tail formation protein